MPLERNWLLRTVVLPACMVSPLWWRFMQNLKQVYESKQRWPYLGNALKYFCAAQVAMFGVFDPRRNGSLIWLSCFVGSTLYQIWWDIFMDWELLSVRNGRLALRRKRLYSRTTVYWAILLINCILRFGWTLSFLPARYLDKSGALRETFKGGLSGVIEPVLASAEIFRRMLWGFLRFEWESIKAHSDDPVVAHQLVQQNLVDRQGQQEDGTTIDGPSIEMTAVDESEQSASMAMSMSPEQSMTIALPDSFAKIDIQSDMSDRSDIQILMELAVWATAFAFGGVIAAAHRATF